MSRVATARELGCCSQTVTRVAKALGLAPAPKGRTPGISHTPQQRERIRAGKLAQFACRR